MKGIRLGYISVLCVFLFISHAVYAADVAKIGVVDIQRMRLNSNAGKYFTTDIGKAARKMTAELEKMQEELKEKENQLKRQTMVMSREMREIKKDEMEQGILSFQQQKKRYDKELRELDFRLSQRFRKDVLKLIDEIGKSDGYLVIIDKAAVFYAPNTIDITDKLIQKYNASFSPPNMKSKKKK